MVRYFSLIPMVILLSCQKDEINLGTDFQRFVGKWENIEGDDRIHIFVQKNGKIEISKSTERGKKIKVNQGHQELDGQEVNGIIWESYFYYRMDKNQNIINNITFAINSSNDSILLHLSSTPILNFTINNGDNANIYKRIE